MTREESWQYEDIVNEIKASDRTQDHRGTTEEEQLEVEIFKGLKRDPYFKHHIQNVIRKDAENLNQVIVNSPLLVAKAHHKAKMQFGKLQWPKPPVLNADDGRGDRMIDGKGWGSGKRKRARAVASVYPGDGRI